MSAQSVAISTNTSGDNAIVSAVAGYAIEVKGYVLTAASGVVVAFKSDTGGGAVTLGTLTFSFTTSGSVAIASAPVVPAGEKGWFQTASGKALNLNLGGAVSVTGHVLYELIAQ